MSINLKSSGLVHIRLLLIIFFSSNLHSKYRSTAVSNSSYWAQTGRFEHRVVFCVHITVTNVPSPHPVTLSFHCQPRATCYQTSFGLPAPYHPVMSQSSLNTFPDQPGCTSSQTSVFHPLSSCTICVWKFFHPHLTILLFPIHKWYMKNINIASGLL